MIQELAIAGQLLNGALDQYLSACTAIEGCFAQGNQLESIIHTLQDQLDDELRKLSSFENKLKQAKAAISSSRNYHTTFVSINTLPSEILARIFRLVLDTQSCTRHERALFPKHPDLLSHVCSRWRRVALNSCALWSHIDLAPCISLHCGLLDRAVACATRAGCLPLDIHVMTLGDPDSYEDNIRDEFEQFLTSIRARVKSLELLACGSTDSPNTHISILKSSLKCCIPGVLTRFTMRNSIWATPTFLLSEEAPELLADPVWPGGILMNDSYNPIEELWERITSLQVFGLYPYWTSAAYRGLVELCLEFGLHPDETISETHLFSILSSCPGLRIFRLDNFPFDSLPSDAEVAPVNLGQLEVLDVAIDQDHNVGCLLRWIIPGSGPLAISFTGGGQMDHCLADTNVKEFFARSTIVRIRLAKMDVSSPDITQLFGLSPDLQTLVLDNLKWNSSDSMAILRGGASKPRGLSTGEFWLNRLEIIKCNIDYRNFKRFLKRSMVQTISIWECRFAMTDSQAPRKTGSKLLHELLAHCAAVEHCCDIIVYYYTG